MKFRQKCQKYTLIMRTCQNGKSILLGFKIKNLKNSFGFCPLPLLSSHCQDSVLSLAFQNNIWPFHETSALFPIWAKLESRNGFFYPIAANSDGLWAEYVDDMRMHLIRSKVSNCRQNLGNQVSPALYLSFPSSIGANLHFENKYILTAVVFQSYLQPLNLSSDLWLISSWRATDAEVP